MCCFSAETHVHGTSIFARFTRPGTQALVYQMRYEAKQPTAMILPLPVALPAKEDGVRWKSLREYPAFFDDLARGFPEVEAPSLGCSRGGMKSAPVAAGHSLAVHEVGDFIASFVPSVNDFGRVDPRFAIPREVWSRIPAYGDYGFAVFQLKQLSGAPHPIAFEFDTRTPAALFFPTVHIHDGTVHAEDAFDHVLYAQEATFDVRVAPYAGPDELDRRTGFVRSRDKISSFVFDLPRSQGLLDGDLLLHKMPLRGVLPNRDTIFDLRAIAARGAGSSARRGSCSSVPGSMGGLDGAALPLTAAAAGLAWIIRRRDARRRERG